MGEGQARMMQHAVGAVTGIALPPYDAPDMVSDGSHFPHSETEVKEQKEFLQKALAEKLKSWDLGPAVVESQTLSDDMLGKKISDQQEMWKEERKALGIQQSDYDAHRARLEKEVRSRVQDSIKHRKMEGGSHDEVQVWGHEPAHKITKHAGHNDAFSLLDKPMEDSMPNLSREDERCLGVLFDALSEGSSVINVDQLARLLNIKVLISANEASEIMAQMDVNKDGHVDFQEFRVYVVQAVVKAFQKLDIDNNGHIDVDEIAPLAAMFDIKSDREFVKKLDWAGDGRVQCGDFTSFVLEDSVEKLTKRKYKTTDMPPQLPILDAERVIRRLFDAHDADGSGTLDTDEVMRLAVNLGLVDKLRTEEEFIRDLLRELKGIVLLQGEKVQGDAGDINFPEFRKWIIRVIGKKWNPLHAKNNKGENYWRGENPTLNAEFDRIEDLKYPTYLGYLMRACGVKPEQGEKHSKAKIDRFLKMLVQGGFAEEVKKGVYSLDREYFTCFVLMDFISEYLKDVDRASDPLYYEALPDFAPPKKGEKALTYDPITGRIIDFSNRLSPDTLPTSPTRPGGGTDMPGGATGGYRQQPEPRLNQSGSGRIDPMDLAELSHGRLTHSLRVPQLRFSDVLNQDLLASNEWYLDQSHKLKSLLHHLGWEGEIEVSDFTRALVNIVDTSFARLDADSSGYIDRSEIHLSCDLMSQGSKADMDAVYQKLLELTKGDNVVSKDIFTRIILEDILDGRKPEQFKHALMVLLSLGRDGRTPSTEIQMKQCYRGLINRGADFRRRELAALDDPLRFSWGLPETDPLVRLLRGSQSQLEEREFTEFMFKFLDRAFENVDVHHDGFLDLVVVKRLVEAFDQRAEQSFHRLVKGSVIDAGRNKLRRHEFFRYFTESCISSLARENLVEGLTKVIEWSRSRGAGGSSAGGPQKLTKVLKELFIAMREVPAGSGAKDCVSKRELQPVYRALRSTFDTEQLRISGGVLSSLFDAGSDKALSPKSPSHWEDTDLGRRLDEPDFIEVMSAILQRVADALQGNRPSISKQDVGRCFEKISSSATGGKGLDRTEFYTLVVDTCISGGRDEGIPSLLAKLIKNSTSVPQGSRRSDDDFDRKDSSHHRRDADGGVSSASSATTRSLEALFDDMDRDKNGYLDRKELGDLKRLFQRCWNVQEDDRMLEKVSGSRVRREDFVIFLSSTVDRAFERLDPDRRGYIARAEMSELARAFGYWEGDLVDRMDRDRNMKVDRKEFISFICDTLLKQTKRGEVGEGIRKIVELGMERTHPTYRDERANLSEIELSLEKLHDSLENQGSNRVKEEIQDMAELVTKKWDLRGRDPLLEKLNRATERRRGGSRAHEFSDIVTSLLQRCFEKMDSNRNGRLEYKELGKFSKEYSGSSKDLVPHLEEKLDRYDGRGGLSRYDFYHFVVVELLLGSGASPRVELFRKVIKSLIQLTDDKKGSSEDDDFSLGRKDKTFDFEKDNSRDRDRERERERAREREKERDADRIDDFDLKPKSKSKKSSDDEFEFEKDSSLSLSRSKEFDKSAAKSKKSTSDDIEIFDDIDFD